MACKAGWALEPAMLWSVSHLQDRRFTGLDPDVGHRNAWPARPGHQEADEADIAVLVDGHLPDRRRLWQAVGMAIDATKPEQAVDHAPPLVFGRSVSHRKQIIQKVMRRIGIRRLTDEIGLT